MAQAHRLLRHDCRVRHGHHDVLPHVTRTGRRLYGHILYTYTLYYNRCERKFTKALDDINNTGIAVWNEHIFFEPKNVEAARLEKGTIELKLMDKGFFKDALIGFYQFDLSYIYLKD